MLVPFVSLEKASEAVSAIFRAGFTPSGLELVEIDALKITSKMVDSFAVPITDDIAAHLIIEVDGNNMDVLMHDMEQIAALMGEYEGGEIFFADDAQQKAELWKLRRRTAEAVKLAGYTIEEDTVVPRAELPALIRGVKELGRLHNFHAVCYGHAGDGNLHIRIKKEGTADSHGDPGMTKNLRALFELVKSLGGTISGEHGVGLIQKKYMDIIFDKTQLQLMRGIKKLFDPNNILNAGKVFDLMNNQPPRVPGTPKEELRAIRIIFGAIIVGVLLFGLIVNVINYMQGSLAPEAKEYAHFFLYAAAGLAAICLVIAMNGYNKGTTVAKETLISLPDKLNQYRLSLVRYIALCDVPALFSIVAFFVTGNYFLFIITVVMIAAMLLKAPTLKRVTDDLGLDWKQQQELE
ncbi:MAG: FAD-linked oxidase C-terminal domain-containing protein [Bacteroidota bacterium]